jgi:hypothetical protein
MKSEKFGVHSMDLTTVVSPNTYIKRVIWMWEWISISTFKTENIFLCIESPELNKSVALECTRPKHYRLVNLLVFFLCLGKLTCFLFLSLINFSASTRLYLEELYLPDSNAMWSVETQPTFRRNMSPPLPSAFALGSCSAYFSTLRMEVICSSETPIHFNRIHGITSQNMELITNAVRTSGPT